MHEGLADDARTRTMQMYPALSSTSRPFVPHVLKACTMSCTSLIRGHPQFPSCIQFFAPVVEPLTTIQACRPSPLTPAKNKSTGPQAGCCR